MVMKQSNRVSVQSFYLNQRLTKSKSTELKLVKEKLRLVSEKLRMAKEELHQKNQMLEIACQAPVQEQQIQTDYQKICGQATSFADDIENPKQFKSQINYTQNLENLNVFVSKIVHDLNNILSPILSISQLLHLQQSELSTESQEMVKIIENSAKRGANLTQQILNYTRESYCERKPLQIAPLLQELFNTVRLTFRKTIRIDQKYDDQSLWLVSADSTQLYQVLMNLCANARDAMPEGGVLSIFAENCFIDQAFTASNANAQMGNYVVITIADTGTGIPPEVRDRIFEPFFTTKPVGQGTGLGLATVLEIVQVCGGFLQILSEVGQGTSVKVYLPALEKP